MHQSTAASRPVYVIGAGFSRAIHERMPLTNELGNAVRQSLGIELPNEARGDNFEEWLTLLSTPLPFLERYANTSRRAQAERITAALAVEVEDRADEASAGDLPQWLEQLIGLWHAERATVVTFNYDTLVERAVTSHRPVVAFKGDSSPWTIRGSQVVYPAPTAIDEGYGGSGASDASFQLLKMHGSLDWYWAQGDGATLVRESDQLQFGEQPDHEAPDLTGARTLDRFLIPPVTSKDTYYDVNLVHMLWRSAQSAIARATSLTIIGYSMPAGDRIAAELLRQVPTGTPVDIVNFDVGDPSDASSPLGRAASLGFVVRSSWPGPDSVPTYVNDRIDSAAARLRDNAVFEENQPVSVVVPLHPAGSSIGHYLTMYGDDSELPRACDLPWAKTLNSTIPPNEISLQGLPSGTSRLDQFYTGQRVLAALNTGRPLELDISGRKHVAVAARREILGQWPVIALTMVPTSSA